MTTHQGKYIEGPKNNNMNYDRFCNVCGEERNKIVADFHGLANP